MKNLFRKTKAVVDLNAFAANLRYIQSTLLDSTQFFCPMIKSNGYGHGDLELARVCEKLNVSGLGVALLEEAVSLREGGISIPIYVFGPILDEAVEQLLHYDITAVIGQWPELKALSKSANRVSKNASVHIKLNTGMNRLGFDLSEVTELQRFFKSQTHIQLRGICSHLACGEDAAILTGRSQLQLQKLSSSLGAFSQWNPVVHMWNSSGWFARLQNESSRTHEKAWGVRPGISIYGVQPLKGQAALPLKPVMSWVSELVTVQNVKKGESVSYGATWTALRDSVVGVVPVGYADGYSRAFSNKGHMLVMGKKVPVIGIVCMDYTMLDLTDLGTVTEQDLGKEVVILGSQGDQIITAESMAQVIQTIPYEILTSIGSRVPREFKDH